ncbi:polysaccharide deacetylase family protein [Paracraurococcus lichenis]|uniref:Chitooligosaccharide deacetylase n=1 Tax=Paracraurococcus lichenis TaxID=3064888 RepID=A0ABT9ECG0_9PROT|nr:polysaccharide deacetylase family protein [Paracraurococcus sp. LOR1-02]MDO9713580.1 polysaccharide deacetylase family protein [Paracraurococcus sp. LOR1-02]
MTEFVTRLRAGTLPDRAVSITFDDGYRDNLRAAKPLLQQAGLPATVFLTTGTLGSNREFWWDELTRLILANPSSVEVEAIVGGQPLWLRFDAPEPEDRPTSCWRAWDLPVTARQKLFLSVWSRLRLLDHTVIEAGMAVLRGILDGGAPDPADCPMTADEVPELLAGGMIELGAHTVTHPLLPLLTPRSRAREIRASKAACEALTGSAVEGFAYPYGGTDPETAALVRDSGFTWACSTRNGGVDRYSGDRFDLPRLQVLDWAEADFAAAIGRMQAT